MTKEKLVSLEKYLDHLNNRLTGATPIKHINHPESFKRFLLNEIRLVKNKIELAKMEGITK